MSGKSSIYQIKISLVGAKPPIWRRFLVPGDMRLAALHDVLQAVMGWENEHLHMFVSAELDYGARDDEFDDGFGSETRDESEYALSQLLEKPKDSLIYAYDFGDGWRHKLVVEKILADDGSIPLPRCTGGKRACPPEDCGGVWGYMDLIEAIADPDHPSHQEMVEWYGDEIDPEHFDVDEINAGLAAYSR